MHYYAHNINDFNNATIHLSVEEECMYHRALAWYYSNEKPLPNDKAKIYRFLRATTKKLQTAVNNILDDFFTEESDGFHQSRCDSEIVEYKGKQAKAVEAGKASAEARRKLTPVKANVEHDNNDISADVQQESNDRSTPVQPTNNQKPITNNQDKKQKLLESVTEVFEFWKSVFDKNDQTKLSDTRKRKIEKRLEDGYTVEQIKQAIFNCSKSDYHVTGNHIDLELICRSIEKMDYFLGLKQQTPKPQTNQDRFGTANDPLAVNQVWGQKPSYTANQTYEDYMAEQEDKIARQNPTQSPAGYEEIL